MRQRTDRGGRCRSNCHSRQGDAESIFLFGPGEAKGELEKRLASAGLGERIVGVETADKMTHHQVAAKVREHYRDPAANPSG